MVWGRYGQYFLHESYYMSHGFILHTLSIRNHWVFGISKSWKFNSGSNKRSSLWKCLATIYFMLHKPLLFVKSSPLWLQPGIHAPHRPVLGATGSGTSIPGSNDCKTILTSSVLILKSQCKEGARDVNVKALPLSALCRTERISRTSKNRIQPALRILQTRTVRDQKIKVEKESPGWAKSISKVTRGQSSKIYLKKLFWEMKTIDQGKRGIYFKYSNIKVVWKR